MTSTVRRIVARAMPNVTLDVATMEELIDASIVPERLMSTLASMFAALGVTLAAVGLYGLLAYSVERRVQEIAVRVALGATRRNVVSTVVRESVAVTMAGVALAGPFLWWADSAAVSMIPALPQQDWRVWTSVAAVLFCVAFIATFIPARRAASIEPMIALRHE